MRQAVHILPKTRGFTLIELGIVVAVISLLATGVMAGQGFIEAARVGRIVGKVNHIRKAVYVYAGMRAGKLFNSDSEDAPEFEDILEELRERELVDSGDIIKASVIDFGFVSNGAEYWYLLFNDKIGPINNTGTKLNYAYHMQLGESYFSICMFL